jgi:AcrR family transcriptional regulator
MKRGPYQLKRRAESQAETRRRIVEAAIELHRSIGPARTTFSAIAELAGVQRLTLYRHFPDEIALGWACSGHFLEQHPPPDPRAWRAIEEPHDRLAAGLAELYDYYATTHEMWTSVLRDVKVHRPTGVIMERRGRFFREIADVLTQAFRLRGVARRLVGAAVTHAVDFHTWESLVENGGLTTVQAADLMGAMVRRAARGARPMLGGRRGKPEES